MESWILRIFCKVNLKPFGLHLLCKRRKVFMNPWTFQKSILFLKWAQSKYLMGCLNYSKTCVKRPLSKRPKTDLKTTYCLMQFKSIIKVPFVIKTFVLSIFEWPFWHRFYCIILVYFFACWVILHAYFCCLLILSKPFFTIFFSGILSCQTVWF